MLMSAVVASRLASIGGRMNALIPLSRIELADDDQRRARPLRDGLAELG